MKLVKVLLPDKKDYIVELDYKNINIKKDTSNQIDNTIILIDLKEVYYKKFSSPVNDLKAIDSYLKLDVAESFFSNDEEFIFDYIKLNKSDGFVFAIEKNKIEQLLKELNIKKADYHIDLDIFSIIRYLFFKNINNSLIIYIDSTSTKWLLIDKNYNLQHLSLNNKNLNNISLKELNLIIESKKFIFSKFNFSNIYLIGAKKEEINKLIQEKLNYDVKVITDDIDYILTIGAALKNSILPEGINLKIKKEEKTNIFTPLVILILAFLFFSLGMLTQYNNLNHQLNNVKNLEKKLYKENFKGEKVVSALSQIKGKINQLKQINIENVNILEYLTILAKNYNKDFDIISIEINKNNVLIKGNSNSLDIVNNYINNLKQEKEVKSAIIKKSKTLNDKIIFTVEVKFKS